MRFKLLFLMLTAILSISVPTFGQEIRVVYFQARGVGPLNLDVIDEHLGNLMKDVCNLFLTQVGEPFEFEMENDKVKIHHIIGNEQYTAYRQGKELHAEKIYNEIHNSNGFLADEILDYLYLIAAHTGPSQLKADETKVCGSAEYLRESPWWRLWEDSIESWAVVDISPNCFDAIETFHLLDVNNDGKVDETDEMLCRNNLGQIGDNLSADVNKDGTVDTEDLEQIQVGIKSWKKIVWITAHELGHAFGLRHDFSDSTHIMSYGKLDSTGNVTLPSQLSPCAIEWLQASQFFNKDSNRESDQKTEIEADSTLIYSKDTEELYLRFSITDDDGLHQVQLIGPTIDPLNQDPQYGNKLYDCSPILSGSKKELITFVYSDLKEHPINEIELQVMDTRGNIIRKNFLLTQSINLTVDNPLTIDMGPRFAYMGNNPPLTYLLDVDATSRTPRLVTASISNDGKLKINPRAVGTAEIKVSVLPTKSPSGVGLIDKAVCLTTGKCGIQRFNVTVTDPQTNQTPQSVDSIVVPSGSSLSTYSTQEARLRATIKGHTDFVSSVAFSPDGQTLASGSWDDTIRLWNPRTEEHLATLTGHADRVTSVAFSPSSNMLVSGSWDKTVRFWNPNTRKHIRNTYSQYTTNETFTSVVAADADGDSYWFASGSLDNDVWLWYGYGLTQYTKKYDLSGHTHDVSSVAFSADERTLASGSHDNTVKLWYVSSRKLRTTFKGHTDFVTSVAFSPDGRTLASGSWDNTIILWDVSTGKSTVVLKGHTDRVLSVAFSPDGRTLASGSDDQTIRLWNVATGQQRDTLLGHTSGVTAVAFSLDRRTLASAGGWDNTVRLWDLSPVPTPAPTVRITPSPVVSPVVGKNLVIKVNISGVQNVAGYQAKVRFDSTALRYIESTNGTYLPAGALFVPPVVNANQVTLAATSLSGDSDGAGTLATLTFEVMAVKPSQITLSDVMIMKRDLTSIPIIVIGGDVVVSSGETLDVNGDGVVSLQDLTIVATHFDKIGENQADVNADGVVDIKDLLLVAGGLNDIAAAPSAYPLSISTLTAEDIQIWLSQTQQLNLSSTDYQKGIAVLQQLLTAFTPKETALLPNYPNPFNPETWIPYQLATPADVTVAIYAVDGSVVRTLALGHQSVGIYQGKNRAAYWDGRNSIGEPVASGVYFYTLTAGEFTATRKMLIRK